jgi:hypothetical protein
MAQFSYSFPTSSAGRILYDRADCMGASPEGKKKTRKFFSVENNWESEAFENSARGKIGAFLIGH